MGTSDTERKGTVSAHPGGSSHSTRCRKGEKRGKPQNTALFQPHCELPSATAELNKTHTWFIFGLALTPPPSSPKLIYGAIVLCSDLTHRKLWALQLSPCPFDHAGVTAVTALERERKEREEENQKQGEKVKAADAHICFLTNSGYGTPVWVPFYC